MTRPHVGRNSFSVHEAMEQNQRHTFRAPIESAHQTARLFTRRAEVMAFVVDESAGGFGIMTDLSVSLSEGETVWLQTGTGCTEARVVNSKMEVGAKRFGLQRLRDLPTDWYEHLARDLWPDIRVQKRLRPWIFIRRRIAVAAGLAVIVLSSTVVAMWDDLAGRVDSGTFLKGWNSVVSGNVSKGSGSKRAATASPATNAKIVPASSSNPFLPPPTLPDSPGDNGREVVRIRAPSKNLGKVIFTLPRAARDVKIDQEQQSAIRTIVDDALMAVDSWAESKPMSSDEQDRLLSVLFDNAATKVLTVLTPEQKARWKARLDQPVNKDQANGFVKSLTTIEGILQGSPGKSKNKSKRSQELAKLLDEARLRTWVNLNPEQREQWRTLLGKSFSQ